MNEPMLPAQQKVGLVDSKGYLHVGDYYVNTKKELGHGSYARVYEGYKAGKESEKLAIKEILLTGRERDKKFMNNLQREIAILQRLDHVNITTIYDVIYFSDKVYIVLELCDQGNLKERLASTGPMQEQEVQVFVSQIVAGYKEMYDKHIIHRDLKPANLLLLGDYHLKITDFGFARELSHMNQATPLTRVGTPLYMSPQILSSDDFSSKCDVWSLGIIIYQMLFGKTPWMASNPEKLLQKIEEKTELRFDSSVKVSDELKGLLRSMLQLEEVDRIGWEQLFQEKYLQDLTKNQTIIDIVQKSIQDSTRASQPNKGCCLCL